VWRSGADRLRSSGQVEVRRRVERLRRSPVRQELPSRLVDGRAAPNRNERGAACGAGCGDSPVRRELLSHMVDGRGAAHHRAWRLAALRELRVRGEMRS